MPHIIHGPFAPTRDWDALRHAYESCEGNLTALADTNNIQLDTLKRYASRRKWVLGTRLDAELPIKPKSPKRVAAPRRKQKLPPPPPPVTEGPAKPVLDQLTDVLIRKLQKIEFDMENQSDLSASDHERHTRALGSITNSLEKVSDLKRADAAGAIDKPSTGVGTREDDADKLRRQLAARIQLLREQLAR